MGLKVQKIQIGQNQAMMKFFIKIVICGADLVLNDTITKVSKVSQFWTRGPVKVQNDTKF